MSETGVIHDIGYRHYDGPRLGRGYLLRSLYVDGLRGTYGLGRATRSKIMPFLLLAIMLLPALVIAIMASISNSDELPIDYTDYIVIMQMPISIFIAAQAPALVSRDLRFRVMPLYFSRPLERSDYVLAKTTAMASALMLLLTAPLLVLYVGALLAELPFWANTRGLVQGLAGALLLALVLTTIGLLIAGLTPRRGFGVAAVVTVLLLSSVVEGVLRSIAESQGHRHLAAYLTAVNPFYLVDGVQTKLLGADPATGLVPPGALGGAVFVLLTAAVILGCYGAMLLRYRRVSAS